MAIAELVRSQTEQGLREVRIKTTELPPQQIGDPSIGLKNITNHPSIIPSRENKLGIKRPITIVDFNPFSSIR